MKHLAVKKFDDDDEVQEEVMTWFKGQAADSYDSGIQKLIPRLNECLDNAGEYVEKQSYVQTIESYVQTIHSQCRFCKLKILYMFKTFVSLLSGQPSKNVPAIILSRYCGRYSHIREMNRHRHIGSRAVTADIQSESVRFEHRQENRPVLTRNFFNCLSSTRRWF